VLNWAETINGMKMNKIIYFIWIVYLLPCFPQIRGDMRGLKLSIIVIKLIPKYCILIFNPPLGPLPRGKNIVPSTGGVRPKGPAFAGGGSFIFTAN
jgi:hypothetical protein